MRGSTINKYHDLFLPNLPNNLIVFFDESPAIIHKDNWRSFGSPSSSIALVSPAVPTSSSSSVNTKTCNYLLAHTWPEPNFSSHREHNPFLDLSCNSASVNFLKFLPLKVLETFTTLRTHWIVASLPVPTSLCSCCCTSSLACSSHLLDFPP